MYPLKDGVFVYQCEGNPLPCYTYAIEPVAFGDINADGVEDVAVILQSWYGGSALGYELAGVVWGRDKPEITPLMYLADRAEIKGLTIRDGLIIVHELIPPVNLDLWCWPDKNDLALFQYRQGKLECIQAK